MIESSVPVSLVNRVRVDIAPVRPLASPSRRLLALVPLALILFLGPPLYHHWRENLAQMPAWTSWGMSALESLGGIALLGFALRQAVPGMAARPGWVMLALTAGLLLFTGVSLTTAIVLPTPLHDPDSWARLAWECVVMELPFAIPSLAISAWLVARALPTRPALTGAAYGLAVGLMTDAGMRLYCWIDQPLHVFCGHGGTILLGMIGGALMAALIERVKYRRLRSSAVK
ncbi:MAG TPA: NrsF family protein [Rhodanobacteraceae bacterium]|nr:NrsF family protein [Rhodanobacteraceae bacterium]